MRAVYGERVLGTLDAVEAVVLIIYYKCFHTLIYSDSSYSAIRSKVELVKNPLYIS